jgi:cytochrome d ubiquinol oxidase subunit I
MNTAGWLVTENGRQPWVVQGLLLTEDGNSPSVGFTQVVISLVSFWILYLILGIVWVYLMMKYARHGLDLDEFTPDGPHESDESNDSHQNTPQPPMLTY